jgi:putative PIN family toxin of toxin-antitoxin system
MAQRKPRAPRVPVTLDSNVYVSALEFGGAPLRLLDAARAGALRLDVSAAILDEVERVLQAKFGWPPAKAKEARVEISRFANTVSPAESLAVVEADPADNKIIECAAAARSDYLVTGDMHLLVLGSITGRRS